MVRVVFVICVTVTVFVVADEVTPLDFFFYRVCGIELYMFVYLCFSGMLKMPTTSFFFIQL